MNEEERYALQSFRERRVWLGIFVAGLLVTAIVGVFGWQLVEPRLQAAKQLDRAVSLVNQANPTLVAFDAASGAAVASPTTATVGALTALMPRMVSARADLTEALVLVDAGRTRLADEEQRQSDIVRTGIEGRLAQAQSAPAIVTAARKAVAMPSLATASALQALVAGEASAYQSGKLKAAGADAALSGL